MPTTICSQLELIHWNDVEKMDGNQVTLVPDKKFIRLILEGNATYQAQPSLSAAGSKLDETITAKIIYQKNLPFLLSALKYYILKLYTDDGWFIAGSLDYPAELTYADNKNVVNLTFKVSSPL